jgi:hypothetical protein
MNFNLYLDRESAERLDRLVKKTHTPRNALVRRAVGAWLDGQTPSWPKEVLEFRGEPSVVPFESHRKDLGLPSADPLAPPRRERSLGRGRRSKR